MIYCGEHVTVGPGNKSNQYFESDSNSNTEPDNQLSWEGRTGEVSTPGKAKGSATRVQLSGTCHCLGGENSK